MTIIGVPYHLDEYLPDLDWPVEPDGAVTVTLPDGGPWERLAVLQAEVARAVAAEAGRGGHLVLLAGDCNTSAGIMAGLQRAGTDPAIVWFDAHGDVQTLETSTSGYLGGLALRLLTGYRPELIAARLGLRPVPEDRIVLAGARDLDPPEVAYLDAAPVRRREIADLAEADLPAGPLYVHVDLDVIDAGVLPGLRYPVPGGPDAAQLADALRMLLATGRVAALCIGCTWRPGHAAARHVAPQLNAVLGLCRVGPHQAQRGGAARPAGLEPGLRRVEPPRRHPAELPGRPGNRRCGVGRPEPPGLRAVRRGQLAAHRDRRLARQPERVRQRAVRQPGDVPQPVGVRPLGAGRSGDVQAVRPVLGQPGRGQRGRLHRADQPPDHRRCSCPHYRTVGYPSVTHPAPPGGHPGPAPAGTPPHPRREHQLHSRREQRPRPSRSWPRLARSYETAPFAGA